MRGTCLRRIGISPRNSPVGHSVRTIFPSKNLLEFVISHRLLELLSNKLSLLTFHFPFC